MFRRYEFPGEYCKCNTNSNSEVLHIFERSIENVPEVQDKKNTALNRNVTFYMQSSLYKIQMNACVFNVTFQYELWILLRHP